MEGATLYVGLRIVYVTFREHVVSCRESEWARIQTTAAHKTILLGQIKMATHNLFGLMYKHLQRRMPAREMDQTLLQLDKVCVCVCMCV